MCGRLHELVRRVQNDPIGDDILVQLSKCDQPARREVFDLLPRVPARPSRRTRSIAIGRRIEAHGLLEAGTLLDDGARPADDLMSHESSSAIAAVTASWGD